MQTPEIRVVIPYGLETLLEGVTRAVVGKNPDNIIEFFALYFQDLVEFRKEHTCLDITELVEQFEVIRENVTEALEGKTSEYFGEPKQRDKCTDTDEEQFFEEAEFQYSSKFTQCPSVASLVSESKSPAGPDGTSSPAGPEPVPEGPLEEAPCEEGNVPSATEAA
ncbi:calcium-binding tyrosine phosphorylation-regulated protein-like [Heliangelus exortis]|uniref:calcium-binding tyrosine phosphorylation-regulated protein-like n=1 Tax=Heliangelus exortis TaxID=472823 RepID=UPI003A92E12F